MSHKIRKPKMIFLTVSVLCLAILTGGTIYAWKGEKNAKSNNKPSIAPSEKSPSKKPNSISANRVKIKKASDPNFLLWKSESEGEKGSSFNKLETKKENILKLLQEEGLCDSNFKSFWENWEQELEGDAWLVKEKRQENDKFVYSDWYENDQGEKVKELGSSKWW